MNVRSYDRLKKVLDRLSNLNKMRAKINDAQSRSTRQPPTAHPQLGSMGYSKKPFDHRQKG
jgi:hypothetical protein